MNREMLQAQRKDTCAATIQDKAEGGGDGSSEGQGRRSNGNRGEVQRDGGEGATVTGAKFREVQSTSGCESKGPGLQGSKEYVQQLCKLSSEIATNGARIGLRHSGLGRTVAMVNVVQVHGVIRAVVQFRVRSVSVNP